jgi:polar amino acid transport system permease protein
MSYQLNFTFLGTYWPWLVQGLWMSIQLSLFATVCGFVLGTVCAVGSTSKSTVLRTLVACYVELIRNTPLLVQLFLVYFGLASLGFKLSATTSAVIGLTINVGAYSSEIIRAGIESIHRGQLEAADTLGLSPWQRLWNVILPPAIEKVYPALVSQYVLLMLATSVASQISAEELTGMAARIQSDTFRSFETYIVILGLYLVLSLVVRLMFRVFGWLIFPRQRKLRTSL